MEDDKTVNIDDIEKEISKKRLLETKDPQVCLHCGRCPVCGKRAGGWYSYPNLSWPPAAHPPSIYHWNGDAAGGTTYTIT